MIDTNNPLNLVFKLSVGNFWEASQKHDYGAITAFRDANSNKENKERIQYLWLNLRKNDFAITKINGSAIENYGSPESLEVKGKIYFVVDVNDRGDLKSVLMGLGEEFEQDCILFGKAGQESVIIGTSPGKDGYQLERSGGKVFSNDGLIIPRLIGRPFVFGKSIESSGNKLWNISLDSDYGIITAYKSSYSEQDNRKRSYSLLTKLLFSRAFIKRIKGSLPGSLEVVPDIFFVSSVGKGGLKNKLLELGKEFEQDSIIFGRVGGKSALIGINSENTVSESGILFSEGGQILPHVNGRPFILSDSPNSGILKEYNRPNGWFGMLGCSLVAKRDWRSFTDEEISRL